MGVWKPLSRQVPSSGQGNWTFDCQSGNFENYGSGNHAACVAGAWKYWAQERTGAQEGATRSSNHVSTNPCMLRIEKLTTLKPEHWVQLYSNQKEIKYISPSYI